MLVTPRLLLIVLIGMAVVAQAADIYRWVDERGVTQYGEKPPENRSSKRVDGRPAAASVDADGKLIEAPKPVLPAPASQQPPVAAFPPPPSAPAPQDKSVRGMDFSTFVYLRRGMSEGEVLLRAGQPDFESVENFRNTVVKSLYYYPTASNPFITIVTVRGGRVADIDRNRKTF